MLRLLPRSLARRFALAAAGLAAGALLVTSAASWWLIERQRNDALAELSARERHFHAAAAGGQLQAIAARMAEVAASTILATGLVDSAGRETYLAPFLAGIRQVNGVPVHVLFTDFEGKTIASNGLGRFNEAERDWLAAQLVLGRAGAVILPGVQGAQLVAMEPLVYRRTPSPEGALLYKVNLADVHGGGSMRLEWGPEAAGEAARAPALGLAVPPVFQPLQFRMRGPFEAPAQAIGAAPEYVAVLALALGLFGAVVLAGLGLARLLTGDLRRLQGFSAQVITSGLSDERAPESGSAEVAGLAQSINRMLDRLHEQQQRKDEFLAMLAHELRNPLAPIAHSLELLKRTRGEGELSAQARATMERQVRHLVRLVDDLLDVSRITRGHLELRRSRVTLASVLEQAVEACRAQIDAAGHALEISAPPAALAVEADPVRLVQVVSNLLNNAAKYTRPGGRIVLEACAQHGEARIRVRDTGMGIAPEMLDRVFDLFTRGEASNDPGASGLGIGLTLARRLVELHGGTLEARSEGLGRGSEFIVRLPLLEAPEAPAPLPVEEPPRPAAGRRVLVVDDNRDAAATLAALLQLTGNQARVAYDGAEAIAAAAEYWPEVVLLDIGLPKVDGYEVCRAMRAQPGGRERLIVALTGWGQDQDRRRSEQAGFNAHLVKPADYSSLARILAASPPGAQPTTETSARGRASAPRGR